MGWEGTLFVGALTGYVGTLLFGVPAGRQRWYGTAIAAASGLLAKMLGNITGLFDDGASLEWLVSVLVAVASVVIFSRFSQQPPKNVLGGKSRFDAAE